MERSPADAVRLRALERPCGTCSVVLRTALARVRIDGLSDTQAEILSRRWGPFLAPPSGSPADVRVRLLDAGASGWLPPWGWGERYRIVASVEDGGVLVRSYYFAIAPEGPKAWRVAISRNDAEPAGRTLDNALRWLAARIAVDAGGIALHGAGVLRGRRAYVFAGPSGSGKSTAVRLSFPGVSLGDDLSILVPGPSGWRTAAVPFDNSEAVTATPPEGFHPVAGVWRLFKGATHRIETPGDSPAAASLTACVASAWAMPDREREMEGAVDRIVRSGVFAHLHFTPDPGFWTLIAR